tara:strand:+ start:7663 stop:8025 length:363 start_codon:yes stop_codon:yes gene_type:complete
MARPTKYTPELLALAHTYLETYTTAIPSHIGLAYLLNISTVTLYGWAKDKDKEEFSNILDRIMQLQYLELTSNGLNSTFNSAICKLVLGKHGLSDRVDTTSSDGSMSPVDKIVLVAKDFE